MAKQYLLVRDRDDGAEWVATTVCPREEQTSPFVVFVDGDWNRRVLVEPDEVNDRWDGLGKEPDWVLEADVESVLGDGPPFFLP